VFTYHLGRRTNNVSELDGLIKGFSIAKSLNLKKNGGGRGLCYHHFGSNQAIV
jgi:hypothetical protein